MSFQGNYTVLDQRSAREASFTVAFTLKKKDYANILDQIKNGNADLSTLASQSIALEPTRRSGSQAKLVRLTRKLSHSMFTALQSAIKCKCSLHNVGLEIAPRKDKMISGNEEDQGAKSLHFDIMVGGYGQKRTQHWDRVRIRLAEENDLPDIPKLLSPYVTPQPPKNRVKFASFLTSQTSNKSIPAASRVNQNYSQPFSTYQIPPILPNPITNLCQLLQKGKGPASDCYGFIVDASRKFNLYTQDGQLENCTTVNLGEVLEEREQGPRRIEYPETLKVALALSSSVLHYYNTPWLEKVVTTEHIAFLCEEKAPSIKMYYLDRPFFSKATVGVFIMCVFDICYQATFSNHQASQLDTLIARLSPDTNYPREAYRRSTNHRRYGYKLLTREASHGISAERGRGDVDKWWSQLCCSGTVVS